MQQPVKKIILEDKNTTKYLQQEIKKPIQKTQETTIIPTTQEKPTQEETLKIAQPILEKKEKISDNRPYLKLNQDIGAKVEQPIINTPPKLETIDLNSENTIKQDNIIKQEDNDTNITIVSESNNETKPKFEIESMPLNDTIESLQMKFNQTNKPIYAILIAKIFYKNRDYKNSSKWALLANNIDDNNQDSWIVFAKSIYKLGQKERAIGVLATFNKTRSIPKINSIIEQMRENLL